MAAELLSGVIQHFKSRIKEFKIIYIPSGHNRIVDHLGRTARHVHRNIFFCWLSYSGLIIHTTSSMSNKMSFCRKKKV